MFWIIVCQEEEFSKPSDRVQEIPTLVRQANPYAV